MRGLLTALALLGGALLGAAQPNLQPAQPAGPPTVQAAVQLPSLSADADGVRIRGRFLIDVRQAITVSGELSGELWLPAAQPTPTVAADPLAPTETAAATPQPAGPTAALATCDRQITRRIGRMDVSLCAERDGQTLPPRTLTAAELGYWWAYHDIPRARIDDAFAIAQCESGAQWTKFAVGADGSREVGPFSIVWGIYDELAAERFGRPLDWSDDHDYMLMVKLIVERSGWGVWRCAERSDAVPATVAPTAAPTATASATAPAACTVVHDQCVTDDFAANTLPGAPYALQNYQDSSSCDAIAAASGGGFACLQYAGQATSSALLTAADVQRYAPLADPAFHQLTTCLLQRQHPLNWVSATAQELGALAVRADFVHGNPFSAEGTVSAAWNQFQAGAVWYWPWSECDE